MKINTQFYIDRKWVELDTLIEKARKWDRRAKAGCMCDERYEAEQKLEAVKKWFEENEWYIDAEYGESKNREELRRILEK